MHSRTTILARINAQLGLCAQDELRVVDAILAGLAKGRHVYGPLQIEGDPRSWRREAAEELRDARIYDAIASLSDADRNEFLDEEPTFETVFDTSSGIPVEVER